MSQIEKISARIFMLARRVGYEFVALSRVSRTGSYNDLVNKPSIPVIPTNVSEFVNDASYASKTYVDESVAGVDALPSQAGKSGKVLGTDGSVASWITVPSDPSKADVSVVGGKADKNFSNVTKPYVVEEALDGSYKKWSTGIVEQYIKVNFTSSAAQTLTVSLPIEMADSSYFALRTNTCSSTGGVSAATFSVHTLTNKNLKIYGTAIYNPVNIYVKGKYK